MSQEQNRYESHAPIAYIKDSIESRLLELNTMLPARIKEYDMATGRALVEPLTNLVFTYYGPDGNYRSIPIPPISDVPVMFFGNKSAHATSKVTVGDTGILLFSQRSLDEWKSQLQGETNQYKPRSFRKFDINDAVFFPAFLAGNTGNFSGLKGQNNEDVQIRSGDSVIGTEGGKAKFKGPDQDISQAIKSLHDRIDKVENSVQSTAASGTFGIPSPSLAIVIVNKIASSILGRVGQLFMNRSFARGQGDLLDKIGRKVIEISSSGILSKEEPPVINENLTIPVEVAVHQEKVANSEEIQGGITVVGDCFGWILKGVNSVFSPQPGTPYFLETDEKSLGDADFSLFNDRFPGWNQVIGFYIQAVGNLDTNYLTILFKPLTPDAGINSISRIVVSMEEVTEENESYFTNPPAINETPYIIGDFRIPELTTLTSVPDPNSSANPRDTLPSIPGLYLQNQISGNIQGVYRETVSAFSSQSIRPVFRLYFFDRAGERVTLNVEDFED